MQQVARERGLSEREATKVVRETEENRRSFRRRWWPDREITAEMFAATLNTGVLEEATMVKMLVTMVSARSRESRPGRV